MGLSTVLASCQSSGTEIDDDDNDVALFFLETPPGRSRVSSLSTSLTDEAIRKRFDGKLGSQSRQLHCFFCFMCFMCADRCDFLGGTPVEMTFAQVMSLCRHIASEVESTAVDPLVSGWFLCCMSIL